LGENWKIKVWEKFETNFPHKKIRRKKKGKSNLKINVGEKNLGTKFYKKKLKIKFGRQNILKINFGEQKVLEAKNLGDKFRWQNFGNKLLRNKNQRQN